MKNIFSALLILTSTFTFAQTDIIEMKSRNASLKKYTKPRGSDNDHVSSNFGMRRDETVRNAVLDSVVCISNEKAIMYTSIWKMNLREPSLGSVKVLSPYMEYVRKKNQLNSLEPNRSPWKPGADTVTFHPLFSKKHSLDSIKMILDRDYYFRNSADSTVFVGYDNQEVIQNEDSIEPVEQKRNQRKNSFGWELIFMIITPIAFLLGMNKLKLIA